jgi:nicotinamidase-related amidase
MATRICFPLLAALLVTLLSATVSAAPSAQPNLPEPRPIVADPNTTALLILDMSTRCDVPGAVCGELAPVIATFLPKARAAHVPIIYTVSLSARGTELGQVWPGFNRQDDEPVIYPDGTDKFVDGELAAMLRERGIDTVIVTGSSSNQAVLYTASGATRNNGFRAIIPMDGSNANSYYEWEYTMHQLNNVSFANLFSFTTLDLLTFGVGPSM